MNKSLRSVLALVAVSAVALGVRAVVSNGAMQANNANLAEDAPEVAAYVDLQDGKYFIQNNESGQFLSNGANWGTRSVLYGRGIEYNVSRGEDGKYTLKSGIKGADKALRPSDGFNDQSGAWELISCEGGFYMYNGSKYFCNSENGVPQYKDAPDASCVWSAVSAADRKALLAKASAKNPVDATVYVKAADFHNGDTENAAWSKSKIGGDYGQPCVMLNSSNCEQWNAGEFTASQVITDLPNGIYRVSCQGYTRLNGTAPASADSYEAGDVLPAYLFANGEKVALKSIFAEADTEARNGFAAVTSASGKVYHIANGQNTAAVKFNEGAYVNELEVEVTDGKLELGVTSEGGIEWVVFDSFRLTYYGKNVPAVEDMTSKIINPQFNDGETGWKLNKIATFGGAPSTGVKGSGNKVITAYNTTFDCSQTIEGLEPGDYKLSVQAFARPIADAQAVADQAATIQYENYIYANDAQQLVMLISADGSKAEVSGATKLSNGLWVPNSSGTTGTIFNAGLYDQSLLCTVGADGKLTIGVKATGCDGSYFGFDNFRLFKVNALPAEDVEALVAQAPDAPMNAAVKAAMDKAIATLQSDATVANYNAAKAAIDAAKESAATYATVEKAMEAGAAKAEALGISAEYKAAIADVAAAYADGTIAGNAADELAVVKAAVVKAYCADMEAGKDLTALLNNTKFDDNNLNGWDVEGGLVSKNHVARSFEANYDASQTLYGLPAGTYKVAAQVFGRGLSNAKYIEMVNAGEELPSNETFLYANEIEVAAPQITSESLAEKGAGNWTEMGDGTWIPDNAAATEVVFAQGLYKHELLVEVGEDGVLTLGVKMGGSGAGRYSGFDNVTLTCVSVAAGETETKVAITSDIFKTWDGVGADAKVVGDAGCAMNFGVETDCPYGDTSLPETHYADLSAYSKLMVTYTTDMPRIFFNKVDGSNQPMVSEKSNTEYYTLIQNEDGSKTGIVDLKKWVADKGFAHLNGIKASAWNTKVTVTEIYLVKEADIEEVVCPEISYDVEDGAEVDLAEQMSIHISVALPEGMDINDDLYLEGMVYGKDGTQDPIFGFTDFEDGVDVNISRYAADELYTIVITKIGFGEVVGMDEETWMPIYENTFEGEALSTLNFAVKPVPAEPIDAEVAVEGTEIKVVFPEGTDLGDNYAVKPYILKGDSKIEVADYYTDNTTGGFFDPLNLIVISLNEELVAGEYTLVLPAGMFFINGGDDNAQMTYTFKVEGAEEPEPVGEMAVVPSLFSGVVGSIDTALNGHAAVSAEVAEGLRVEIANCPQAIGVSFMLNEMKMGQDEEGTFWTVGKELAVGEIEMTRDSYAAFDAPIYFYGGTKYQLTVTVYAEVGGEPAEIATYTYEFNGAAAPQSGSVADGIDAIKQGAADGKYMKGGKVVIVKNGKTYTVAGQRVK